MNKTVKFIIRFIAYISGLSCLALGISFSKLSALGISPVSSVPAVLSQLIPGVSLGNMVIVIYCSLVIVQLIILRKKFKISAILGVPIAILFGMLVDIFGTTTYRLKFGTIDLGLPFELKGLLINFPKPEGLVMRFVYLAVSMVIISIGVYMYIQSKLWRMPPDGVSAAISEVTGMQFGSCKTIVDVSLITIAVILQVIFLGGFKTLGIGGGIVGIGTILSAIFVGQIVRLITKPLNKLFKIEK